MTDSSLRIEFDERKVCGRTLYYAGSRAAQGLVALSGHKSLTDVQLAALCLSGFEVYVRRDRVVELWSGIGAPTDSLKEDS